MKLIYIQNVRIPTEKAHGIQIIKMCESFAQVLDSVESVVPRRFNRIKKSPFDYYGIPAVFKIRKLPCLDLIFLDRYLGHLSLWITSGSFSFFSFWYLFSKKVDIIYTRDKFLLYLSFFKKNVVFEAHTFPQRYFLYAIFMKRLKGIVVITRKLGELFIGRGISSDKILVAPDGVDLELFNIPDSKSEAREKLHLPQDKKLVIYTGHLYKWKGVQTLAHILVHAVRYTDAEVYLVGGTEEDVKRLKSGTLGIERIHIVGHRPYSEMPYWLKASDVLVLPNSDKEEISVSWTSPMKMFEYMAARRPIVASDLPSLREVLNEENAFLVKPDDAVALAEGIKNVLEDPQLSERLSDKAFKDVKEYSWRKRVENILKFVKS